MKEIKESDKVECSIVERSYKELEEYQNETLNWMAESIKSPLAMKTIK